MPRPPGQGSAASKSAEPGLELAVATAAAPACGSLLGGAGFALLGLVTQGGVNQGCKLPLGRPGAGLEKALQNISRHQGEAKSLVHRHWDDDLYAALLLGGNIARLKVGF